MPLDQDYRQAEERARKSAAEARKWGRIAAGARVLLHTIEAVVACPAAATVVGAVGCVHALGSYKSAWDEMWTGEPNPPPVQQAVKGIAVEVMSEKDADLLAMLIDALLGGFIAVKTPSPIRGVPSGGLGPGSSTAFIRPLNGRINVGGGFERGASEATNLNPIIPGTGGPGANASIPNHIRAGFEQIGEIFEEGSANLIFSNRLPYNTVNWESSALGAYRVMTSGGRLSLNVWAATEEEAAIIIRAFSRAGFRDVRASGSGSGTIITGVK